jgi:predicted ArsR family transcriptional regulator
MPLDQTVLTDFKSLLQQLYNELNEDFWNTDDATVAAAVNDLANSVNAALTQLNQLGMAQNDAVLQAIQSQVADIDQQLQEAQKKIATWVKDFGYAAQVASLIDKAVELASKLVK